MDGVREKLITDVVSHEWSQFDRVNNVGGRADCQDDFRTFDIMRRAQYMNWPDELLESYLADLETAESEQRNLIAEKYGRMMESTSPAEYENIKHLFPVRSEDRLMRQEAVIAREVAMDEVFCSRYPLYAAGGRRTRTSEDTIYSTSKETYMRGEMSTWSDRTFSIYEKWIGVLEAMGKNLPEMIAENIARGYGFASLADAEEFLRRKHQGEQ